jgi:hypothetical protein
LPAECLREREKNSLHLLLALWHLGSGGGSLGGVQLPSPARQRAAPIPWAACAQQAVAGSRPAGKQWLRRAAAASSGPGAEEWPRRAAGKQRQRAIPGFLQQRARLRSGRQIEIQSPESKLQRAAGCCSAFASRVQSQTGTGDMAANGELVSILNCESVIYSPLY